MFSLRNFYEENEDPLEYKIHGVMAQRGVSAEKITEDFLIVRLGTILNDVNFLEIQASPAGKDWQLKTELTLCLHLSHMRSLTFDMNASHCFVASPLKNTKWSFKRKFLSYTHLPDVQIFSGRCETCKIR